MRIILASQSPRRARVLKDLGIKFDVIPSNFDEDKVKIAENDPQKLVEKLAIEKAKVVAQKNPNAAVIGADNVVTLNGKIVGKPKDLQEARKIILSARGKKMKAYNGVAIIYKGKMKSATTVGIAKFKNYSEKEVDDYIKTSNPLDKAGGFAGDPAEGGQFLESFIGEPGEELGMPTLTLKKLLKEHGIN